MIDRKKLNLKKEDSTVFRLSEISTPDAISFDSDFKSEDDDKSKSSMSVASSQKPKKNYLDLKCRLKDPKAATKFVGPFDNYVTKAAKRTVDMAKAKEKW